MQLQPYVSLGYFNMGGGEVIVLLAIVLMLFGSDNMPRIAKWLWGDDARDVGRSFGGIYGRKGFQALRPDNKVGELYRPSLRRRPKKPTLRKSILRWLSELWAKMLRRLGWR